MSDLLYSALRNPSLKRILSDVRTVCAQLNLDFFAVGALARNIWYAANELPPRGTKDLDFALYIPNRTVYNHLRQALIGELGYIPAPRNAFCLISPYGVPVDLLPFGEIEEEGKVLVEGQGLVEIKLDGFAETYQNALINVSIEEDTLSVCTIPAVVLLKLIAFDDRPEQRPNDPSDIDAVLRHYPHLEADLIWDEYDFLYGDDSDHETIGVEVLGHEVSKIIRNNRELYVRVLRILDDGIAERSTLARRMVSPDAVEPIVRKMGRLEALRRGVVEGLRRLDQ